MDSISYIGLSQQMALHQLMDVTANNIANMNTPGFKSENILFHEYVNQAPGSAEKVSQVQSYGSYHNLSQGTLTQTFNNLDAAIQGDGYFAVQTPEGVRYTRNGAFSLNNKNEIVTKAGHQVMSEGGGPITLPADAAHISILENGEVATEKGPVGKLKIASFENPQLLKPQGEGLYDAGNLQTTSVTKPHVYQGMLETSNVQPILEMNRMMEVLRMYQASQNMLMTDHDRQRTVIQRLTRI